MPALSVREAISLKPCPYRRADADSRRDLDHNAAVLGARKYRHIDVAVDSAWSYFCGVRGSFREPAQWARRPRNR